MLVPTLTSQDIRTEVEHLFGQVDPPRHNLVAFFGTGNPEVIESDKVGRIRVLPVRCELELRAKLIETFEASDRYVFLVPWTDEMPLDLAGRFARAGRVRPLGRDIRLRRLFGTLSVEPDAFDSPLADYLLTRDCGEHSEAYNLLTPPQGWSIPGDKLTKQALWETWLARELKVPAAGGLGLDSLLGWAAVSTDGPTFCTAMKTERAAKVPAALLQYLTTCLGPAGALAWQAWERGKGGLLLQYAVIAEGAGSPLPQVVTVWLAAKLQQELDWSGDRAEQMFVALGRSASGALRYVEEKEKQKQASTGKAQLIAAADALVDQEAIRAALTQSRRLPSSWTALLDQIGVLLQQAAMAPARPLLEQAIALRRRLEEHDLFTRDEQVPVVERALHGVRLLAWLIHWQDHPIEAQATEHGDLEELAEWYTRHGAFVDWARQRGRGSTSTQLGKGVNAVVVAADAVRQGLDRRFAHALVAWIHANRPSKKVVPIDHVVKRVVIPFVEGGAGRRLLLVVMDGMAWLQATQLIASLHEQEEPWGPLAFNATISTAKAYAPVIAALPTITEISRSALFDGAVPSPGPQPTSSSDSERFKKNKQLVKLFSGTKQPRLLLKQDAFTSHGTLTEPALVAIADEKAPVVALIINALDELTHGSGQIDPPIDVQTIKALPELLKTARGSGRAVLLVSDHGHMADHGAQVVSKQADADRRWRPFGGDVHGLESHEVAVAGEGVWHPKGASGIVLIADEAHMYKGGGSTGEHGGASMAEVIAPCVLLGWEQLTAIKDDPKLKVSPPTVPPWWHFDIGVSVRTAGSTPATVPIRGSETPTTKRQLTLPGEEQVLELITKHAQEQGHEEELLVAASPWMKNEILQARTPRDEQRRDVVRVLEYLGRQQGVAHQRDLALAMGLPEFRVYGFISYIQEVLNIDGYQVLRFDQAHKSVHLHADLLAQLFEVGP